MIWHRLPVLLGTSSVTCSSMKSLYHNPHVLDLQNNFIILGVFMETFSTKMKPSKWPDKIEQDLKLGRRVRYVSVVIIGFYYNNTPCYNRQTQILFTRVEKFGQYIPSVHVSTPFSAVSDHFFSFCSRCSQKNTIVNA